MNCMGFFFQADGADGALFHAGNPAKLRTGLVAEGGVRGACGVLLSLLLFMVLSWLLRVLVAFVLWEQIVCFLFCVLFG